MQEDLDRLIALGFDEKIVKIAENCLADLTAAFGDGLFGLVFAEERRDIPGKLREKSAALGRYRPELYLQTVLLLRGVCADLHPEAARRRVRNAAASTDPKAANEGEQTPDGGLQESAHGVSPASPPLSPEEKFLTSPFPAPVPLDLQTRISTRRLVVPPLLYDTDGPDGTVRFYDGDPRDGVTLIETTTRKLLRPHALWGWRQRPIEPLAKHPEIAAWNLGKGFTVPDLTTENVWAVLNALIHDERWQSMEAERHELFDCTHPENRDSDVILQKMDFITQYTGAALPSPRKTALRIARAGKLDEALFYGMSVGSALQVDAGINARYGGFASLYCSAHVPETIPLYTPNTLRSLRYFRDVLHEVYFLDREVTVYETYLQTLHQILSYGGIKGVNLARLSIFLEIVGKKL